MRTTRRRRLLVFVAAAVPLGAAATLVPAAVAAGPVRALRPAHAAHPADPAARPAGPAAALHPAGPAAASATGTGTAAGTETVTVYLKAPDGAALDRLAEQAPALDRTTDLDRLADLVPTAAAVGDVATRLAGLGLTVTGRTAWSVTARGPAAVVRTAFGSARATKAAEPTGQPLPDLPAALRGRVAVAVGGDETRPALHPAELAPASIPPGHGFDGTALRDAYRSTLPATAPTSAPTPTVATLQLSGWARSDLTTYAQAAGLPDPVAAGRYQAVLVGRGEAYDPVVDQDDDAEVSLDQEALLAAAPTADQRAYFAPNTWAGILAALTRIATDARAPGAHMVAFSTSWGACEASWGTALPTAQNLLAAATAAGVTVFAASGDRGSRDCDGATGVDFPASSPLVVGVGGTSLVHLATGGWRETAWSGSGGGCSATFAKPVWQATAAGALCPGRRAVPDIALDADPGTGFAIVYEGGWNEYGGTSLGPPLAAGMIANAWVTASRTTGYGDVHPALYASRTAFRDITSGGNGGFQARAGYDLVTGLGAPQWALLGPRLAGGSPWPQPTPSPTPSPTPQPTPVGPTPRPTKPVNHH